MLCNPRYIALLCGSAQILGGIDEAMRSLLLAVVAAALQVAQPVQAASNFYWYIPLADGALFRGLASGSTPLLVVVVV